MSENYVPMSEFEWDGICEKKEPTTQEAREEYYKGKLAHFHKNRNAHKREQIIMDALWYLLTSIGIGVVSIWLQGKWQIACIILAAVVGMIATYGFGMARGLRRK